MKLFMKTNFSKMQKKVLYVLLIFVSMSCSSHKNKLAMNEIYLADPTIFKDDNMYYLYGTSAGTNTVNNGFMVYSSKDLKNWNVPSDAINSYSLNAKDAFGDKGFWAPQVFKDEKQYYMAYTANEQIAIATSDNPIGPFLGKNKSVIEGTTLQIDPFVFFDDDGKAYLYLVKLKEGNRIFVAEMNDDLTAIKPETLKECLSAELTWENTLNAEWPVSEGPTVIKHDELYYMIYSANDFRNQDYAVGYATSTNPLGPWIKSDRNPLISRKNISAFGTGHGDLFIDLNKKMHYVFHTHYSKEKVGPRKTAIIELEFKKQNEGQDIIVAKPETFQFLFSYE